MGIVRCLQIYHTIFSRTLQEKKSLHLNLASCSIEYIPPDLFISLPTIHTLDLSGNHLMSMNIFEEGSKGLENSTLTVLNISFNVLNFPVCSVIKNTTFQHLKSTPLKVLVVESCKLVNIYPEAIFYLPQTVEYVSFHNNRLVQYFFLWSMVILRNLKELTVSEQVHYHLKRSLDINQTYFSSGLGQNGSMRHIYDLRWTEGSNELPEASNLIIQNTTGKTHKKRKRGRWSVLHTFSSSPTSYFNKIGDCRARISLPARFEFLNVSDIEFPYDISRIEFTNNHVLKYFDFSSNIVKIFNGPLYGLPSLEYLDISRNFCFQVKPLFFFFSTAESPHSSLIQEHSG